MAIKKVITSVTLHAPHPRDFKPFEYDNNGAVLKGRYAVTEYAPGSEVELDESEADGLIERGIVVASKKVEPTVDPRKP